MALAFVSGSPRRPRRPRPHRGEILQIQDIKMSILLFRRVAIRGPSDRQTGRLSGGQLGHPSVGQSGHPSGGQGRQAARRAVRRAACP